MIRDVSAGVHSCNNELTKKYAVAYVPELLHMIYERANARIKYPEGVRRWGKTTTPPLPEKKNGPDRTGQVRSGQVRSGQVRSGQVRSGQVRSGQVRSGQVRSGQVRSGQVRTFSFFDKKYHIARNRRSCTQTWQDDRNGA
jgi:hypothetical protein